MATSLMLSSIDGDAIQVHELDQVHMMMQNVWSTPNDPHTQTVSAQTYPDGYVDYAITWNWPNVRNMARAYPEILHGKKPWSSTSTDSRFPFKIRDRSTLRLEIPKVSVKASGSYAVAFDLWIVKDTANPVESIVAELFIVAKSDRYALPKEQATVTSRGIQYGYGKWSESSRVNIFWRKASTSTFKLPIDFYSFISFLISSGSLSTDDYLFGVELGVEPQYGSGTLKFNSFHMMM